MNNNRMNSKISLKAAACGLALFGLLVGCSEPKKEKAAEEKKEKGAVEKMTDKVADQAVQQIQKPIDKAKDVQAVQNVQTQDMKNMVDQQAQDTKNAPEQNSEKKQQ